MRNLTRVCICLAGALACAPKSPPLLSPDITQIPVAADSADHIFRALITWYAVGIDSRLEIRPYGLRIDKVWKGARPDTILLFQETVGSCPFRRPHLFGKYIFYARRDTSGAALIDRCSRFVPVRGDSSKSDERFLRALNRHRP